MNQVVDEIFQTHLNENFLQDGRIFFPNFDDDGQSYNRLRQAVSSRNQEEELQKLADYQSENCKYLTDLPEYILKLRAAALILRDLVKQGWIAGVEQSKIKLYPPTAQDQDNPYTAKKIARQAGLFAREDQFKEPSVRRFITSLESPSRGSQFIPITKLIADGRILRQILEPIAKLPIKERGAALRQVIKPYLQLVEPDKRCPLTGIKYTDIWRYFRLSWSIPYNSSPGRNLFFLIRDAGQPYHPVMAITALGNSVLQLTCRDQLLGWLPEDLMKLIDRGVITAEEGLRCLQNGIEKSLREIYIADLPINKSKLKQPNSQIIEQLLKFCDFADLLRQQELKQGITPKRVDFNEGFEPSDLIKETQSSLFQLKRVKALTELLRARLTINAYFIKDKPLETLEKLLEDEEGRIAFGIALRHARQRMSGSAMMEIVVCGGIKPYSDLLSGKLACLMMLSPEVSQIYEERYGQSISIIASQMAGRPVCRPSKLVYLETTSLYAVGSSQYNRVVLPAGTMPGQGSSIRYQKIGYTKGYGSAHLSKETIQTLKELEITKNQRRRVNNIFGEGANPKWRQLVSGMKALGLAEADLLRHASPRIVYSIPLIRNLERYLLQIDESPEFITPVCCRKACHKSTEKISIFWLERWVASRLEHAPLFKQLGEYSPLKLRVSRELPKLKSQSKFVQLELPFLETLDRDFSL